MNEERRKILDMLAQGKVTAEEADQLLAAVEQPEDALPQGSSNGLPRYLFVKVEPKEGSEEGDQVNIRVPLALVKAGVNLAGLLPKDARTEIEGAMKTKGMNFDFNNLSAEEIDALMAALQELHIDVDTKDANIRIYAG